MEFVLILRIFKNRLDLQLVGYHVMKNSVGIFEAKTHFTKIITQVIAGDEILITRRGRAVAKIIPIKEKLNGDAAKAAIFRLKKLAKEMQLGSFNWDEWKNYKDEGRP